MLMRGQFISKRGVFIGGLLALVILRRCYYRYWDPNLIITFFDVGQGDSALIQFPFGKTMLVDGGGGWGKFSLGERVLIPELSRLSILRLDHVILSHPDSDHAFGLLAVLKNLKVKELWLSGRFFKATPPKLLTEIEGLIKTRKIKPNILTRPNQLEINQASVELIPLSINKGSRNNEALILGIQFGKCRALFTGDIESEGEAKLAKLLPRKFHLLKVPHHGSLTSSSLAFLHHFDPKWAIVSVGLTNRYRHPRSEVLSRYRALGIDLFRTDFHGAVRFTVTPKSEVKCETYLGDCGVTHCN